MVIHRIYRIIYFFVYFFRNFSQNVFKMFLKFLLFWNFLFFTHICLSVSRQTAHVSRWNNIQVSHVISLVKFIKKTQKLILMKSLWEYIQDDPYLYSLAFRKSTKSAGIHNIFRRYYTKILIWEILIQK